MAYVTQPAYDQVTQSTRSLVVSLRTRTEKSEPADERETEERSGSLFAGYFALSVLFHFGRQIRLPAATFPVRIVQS